MSAWGALLGIAPAAAVELLRIVGVKGHQIDLATDRVPLAEGRRLMGANFEAALSRCIWS